MIIKILIGAVIGAVIGFGMNYLCMITGGTCPLIKSKLVAIFIWALIGGMIGATIGAK